MKISQSLPKLWAIKYGHVFYETRCIFTNRYFHKVVKIANFAK